MKNINTLVVGEEVGQLVNTFSTNHYEEDLFIVLSKVLDIDIPYGIRLHGIGFYKSYSNGINDYCGYTKPIIK